MHPPENNGVGRRSEPFAATKAAGLAGPRRAGTAYPSTSAANAGGSVQAVAAAARDKSQSNSDTFVVTIANQLPGGDLLGFRTGLF